MYSAKEYLNRWLINKTLDFLLINGYFYIVVSFATSAKTNHD